MSVFHGAFKSWKDVRAAFPGCRLVVPDKVIYAGVEPPLNSGDTWQRIAHVVYRHRGAVYWAWGDASSSPWRTKRLQEKKWHARKIDAMTLLERLISLEDTIKQRAADPEWAIATEMIGPHEYPALQAFKVWLDDHEKHSQKDR